MTLPHEKPDSTRLYLITPSMPQMASLPQALAGLLDEFEIACVRMSAATGTEDDLRRIADNLRDICHARDVPLLISDHFRMASAQGLDGVHLTDGARNVRSARKSLATDSIVGAYARASRHDGMNAAEIGADYVSFGPVSQSSLGDGNLAGSDLFAWWSELIEVPVVAEGGMTPDIVMDLAPFADFIALGDEIWSHPAGPRNALADFSARLR